MANLYKVIYVDNGPGPAQSGLQEGLYKVIYVDNGPGPAQSGLQKGAAA